jgi:hypothetical protein
MNESTIEQDSGFRIQDSVLVVFPWVLAGVWLWALNAAVFTPES